MDNTPSGVILGSTSGFSLCVQNFQQGLQWNSKLNFPTYVWQSQFFRPHSQIWSVWRPNRSQRRWLEILPAHHMSAVCKLSVLALASSKFGPCNASYDLTTRTVWLTQVPQGVGCSSVGDVRTMRTMFLLTLTTYGVEARSALHDPAKGPLVWLI